MLFLTPSTTKRLFSIALLSYGSFLFLAVWYYQERILFADLAYHLFYIIKDGNYEIQNGRFGSVLTQSIPLIGSYLGLSLKTITLAYSVGFVLFYFGIFLLIWKVLKNPILGLVLLLLNTIMVGGTFFWIQSEFPQGLAFMLLTFAIITRKQEWRAYYKLELLLLLPMLVAVVYFHPLIFIPFTYSSLFIWLSQDKWPINRTILGGSFAVFWLVFLLKNTLLKVNYSYENSATAHLENFWTLFPNYFFIDSNANFVLYIATTALVVLFFGMSYWYVREKKWLKLLLLWSFFVGYFLLIGVTFNTVQFSQFYLENLYLPLSLMVAFPFVVDGLPAFRAHWQVVLIAAIVVTCLGRIYVHSLAYTKRLNWQKELLAKTAALPNKKLLIDSADIPRDVLLYTYWGSPYEFWLLSSMDEHSTGMRSIVIHDDPWSLEYIKNNPDYFLTYWGNFPYKELSSPYFNLNDSSPYVYYNPKGN